MNRTIKFRGKNLYNNEWIFGDLIQYESGEMAIFSKKLSQYGCEATEMFNRSKVETTTVGQFTGLFDKNGNEIYEGDIVKFHFMTSSPSTTKLFPTAKFFGEIITNKYNQWAIFSDGMEIHIENAIKHGEIAGNIYDNPELIKEE